MTAMLGLCNVLEQPAVSLFGLREGTFWLPPQRSTIAPAVDNLFYTLLGISAFFFLLILGLMTLFVIRYRYRPGVGPQSDVKHSTALEIFWSVIPLMIVTYIFYEGFVGYVQMRTVPDNAYEIEVVAGQWSWLFLYDGLEATELHVPADRPVRLVMRSDDVIHSLWIPDFRVKMDIVPGRKTETWFEAPWQGETSRHALKCTEYCGTNHSTMLATVVVHRQADFDAWLADARAKDQSKPAKERGEDIYNRYSCIQCHSIDGTMEVDGVEVVGPSFKGIWGETHEFSNAPDTEVDYEYLKESLFYPSEKIRRGYPDKMSSYKGRLSDEQIRYIKAFIESLKD